MLHLLQISSFKVLTTLPLQIQNSWSCPSHCCVPTCNTVTFSSDFSCLPSLSSLESAFLHCGVHSFLSVLSLTLTLSPPYDLVLWTDGSVPFPFGKDGSGVLASCTLCGTEATLSCSAGPVCSSFSSEACAILHALCWSLQHHKVYHFFSLI